MRGMNLIHIVIGPSKSKTTEATWRILRVT